MEVLAIWSAKLIVHSAVIEMFVTIVGCYIIAASLGHVPVWLPMISDCALKPPEKYIFRLGVVVGAFLISLQSVTVYYANRERRFNKLCSLLVLISSIGWSGQ